MKKKFFAGLTGLALSIGVMGFIGNADTAYAKAKGYHECFLGSSDICGNSTATFCCIWITV
jgi:hypothetical protein